MNKLLADFNTQYNAYPFQDISNADIEEAINCGIAEEKKSIETICACNDQPTFENTILPFESSGETLSRATTLLYNLLSANRNDELENIAEKITPILTAHQNEIYQNKELFARVDYVKQNEKMASPEDQMLLDKIYDAFVNSGIALCKGKRQRFNQIKEELAQLKLQFSKNLVNETKEFHLLITDERDISGLPEINVQQAAEKAIDNGTTGWWFDLYAPSYIPFMSYIKNRNLRKEMYMAYNTRCSKAQNNNAEICKAIVNLKRELAQILGYKSYAEYVLKNRMAERVENVDIFLDNLKKSYLPFAQKEVQEIADFASSYEGYSVDLQPWDFAYYAQKLKQKKFDFDPDQVRPYLELSNVINGVFGLATRLYGISFKRNDRLQVYHRDVVAYEVYDKDDTFLALFYTDFFPRASKQGGAWMTSYLEQKEGRRPHVSIVMNFTPPTQDKPSLLTLDEVETFLHEFGHALHGIFANTKYASLSGTNVYWDFVELPSQIMENYLYDKEFLCTFARHYQSQELIPQELLDNILLSRNFNVAYACIRQLSFGLLDMSYYSTTTKFDVDLNTHERAVWQDIQLLPFVDGTCMTTQFSHIMDGGYSAGYYSYKWAEVLDADAFSVFKAKGVFNQAVAESFRTNILEKGGTQHPMLLYKNFRQAEPSIDALLERNGLK
jgi:peptidyl-dipeptidase Dcp